AFAAVHKEARRCGVHLLHDVEGRNIDLAPAGPAGRGPDRGRIARPHAETENLEGVLRSVDVVLGFALDGRVASFKPHKGIVWHSLSLLSIPLVLVYSNVMMTQLHNATPPLCQTRDVRATTDVCYPAGCGRSATRRMETVSSSNWKCGFRNATARYAP